MISVKRVQFAPDTVFFKKSNQIIVDADNSQSVPRIRCDITEIKACANTAIETWHKECNTLGPSGEYEIKALLIKWHAKINAADAPYETVRKEIKAFIKELNEKLDEWQEMETQESIQSKPLILNTFDKYLTKFIVITFAASCATIAAAYAYNNQQTSYRI